MFRRRLYVGVFFLPSHHLFCMMFASVPEGVLFFTVTLTTLTVLHHIDGNTVSKTVSGIDVCDLHFATLVTAHVALTVTTPAVAAPH